MSADRRPRPTLLAAPTFGLALSATAIGTYLPLIARHLGASAPVAGALPAAQGLALVALSIPVGFATDRIGRHRGFLLVGAMLGAGALGFVGVAQTVPLLIVATLLFFCGYVAAYEPYRAALLNLVSRDRVATAQSAQAGWRAAGTGIALLGGGALAGLSLRAPILLAAGCLLVSGALGRLTLPSTRPERAATRPSTWRLLRERPIVSRSLLVAGLSELALAVVRAFGLLYVTERLHLSAGTASFLFAGFTVLSAVAAVAVGPIADRVGIRRVMLGSGVLYAGGLAAVGLSGQTTLLVIAAAAAAIGGGAMTTLSYALGADAIPASLRGRLTGATTAARGLGLFLGPTLGAAALAAGGFAASFSVAAAAVAIAVVTLLPGSRPARR